MSKTKSRRKFLQTSAAAVAAPTIVPSTVFAQGDRPAPSDRVVVGSIGVGDLGRRHHLNNVLLKNPRIEVAAVCDVDRAHREEAAKDCLRVAKKRVGVYKDFRDVCDRKDIDACLVVTPDHWHTLCSIAVIESGKDVYCEKPLTLTIEEGKAFLAAARRYGAVVQTGSQQRSDKRFRQACELVRNNKIGKLVRVDTFINGVGKGPWEQPTTPPPELDWNFWLGPAPYADYTPDRCYYNFRWYSDYSGGKMTDWGAHHNDIAQWGIGADGSGPVKVKPVMTKYYEDNPYDVMYEFDLEYTYANGVVMHCRSDKQMIGDKEENNGILFTGTNGWVFVNRGSIRASDEDLLKYEFTGTDIRLEESKNHHENWLDCIKSRNRPICDVEVGYRSVTVCHLGNIAGKLGRELTWDPKAEQFVGDAQALALQGRPMRAPWHL